MTLSRSHQPTGTSIISRALPKWLDYCVFACLVLTFGAAPHSIKQAARFCTVGTILLGVCWLLRLLAPRTTSQQRFVWHPLFRPVLLFLLLAALSTAFSSAPDWSWRRMEWFSLMLAVIVAGNAVRTRARVVGLVLVLLLSSSAILVRTGWQYVHGIGVKLQGLAPMNPLVVRGLQPDDIIQTLNGDKTRSPGQFREAVKRTASNSSLTLAIARGAPIERVMITINRHDFDAALTDPGLHVARGRPLRAQAGFYHYVPFAGFMCVIALLGWGLFLTARSTLVRVACFALFVGASAAVAATLTRTYLVALLIGAFAAFWMVSRRQARVAAVTIVALVFVAFTLWIRQERGIGWVALDDAGTQYRMEMWRDGVRLIRAHPLLGIGLDATMSGKWDIQAYKEYPLKSHFHSTPIQLAVDTGLPTLVAWLWIAVVFIALLRRLLRQVPRHRPWLRGVVLGVFGAAVAFYVASLVHYNQGDGEVLILVSVLMGVAVGIDTVVQSLPLMSGNRAFVVGAAPQDPELHPTTRAS